MKNFKLLLKNSMKSLWDSRGLVTQFTVLTTIATVVVSSVSLANFSLHNTMSSIQNKSNLNGFSIESRPSNNFASYALVEESNKLVKSLDKLTTDDATGNTKIYNPLNNYQTTKTSLTVNDKTYETYGFFQKYENNNYDTSADSQKWKNIAFSDKDESLSILSKMTDEKYATEISDIFSFYDKMLPPEPNRVQDTNYRIFFDPSIYSFNPWTFTNNTNNQLVTNPFGVALVNGFENEFSNDVLYNHGIFDSKYSFIVGTDITFLDQEEMSQYFNDMMIINNDVKLAVQIRNVFSNNWKQQGKTYDLGSKWDIPDVQSWWFRGYGNNYYQFLNLMHQKVSSSFMVDVPYFTFNYSINPENSQGIVKFFSDIYKNKENKYHSSSNEIFKNFKKEYFDGSIKIPLIPFMTVAPKIPNGEKWAPEQYRDWAANGDFKNSQKAIPDVSGIRNAINSAFNRLSSKLSGELNSLLNSANVKPEIRNDYLLSYDLEYFLNQEMKLNFSKSSNFIINDFQNNSYMMNKNNYYNNVNKVNDLFIHEGDSFIKNKINNDYLSIPDILGQYNRWRDTINDGNRTEQERINYVLNDKNFFPFMNILKQTQFNTSTNIINEFNEIIDTVLDLDLLRNNFEKWRQNAHTLLWIYRCTLFRWNGAGYVFEFTRKNAINMNIDFNGFYYEPSSFTSVVSMNYAPLKSGKKKIIDPDFAKKAMRLPYKSKGITQEDVIANFSKYKNHFIYNPYTGKEEFYNDFYDWLDKLDKKYKINVNGDEFVIMGTGVSSEFVYPITSTSQLLINNNSPVVFTNPLGYDKVAYNNTVSDSSHYFVNYSSNILTSHSSTLNKINEWTRRVNGKNLAYDIKDENQPNKLLYQRMNFPYSILRIVFLITILIATIIVGLSLVFIFVLMRSIINQNMNTFAIGMANGIRKRKLLLSFMPFVLIPSSISALLGYGISFFTYPIISNAIQDYWILDYIQFPFNPGYLLFTFLIVTLVIFLVQAIVVYIMLNKNVTVLLNQKFEFKSNKLVQATHKAVTKLKPLTSFRLTYMLGNFGRLILLLLMMTSFVSLTTISASTINTFTTAVQKTVDNKQYNYAVDLITPTEQGGYYYDIPYNLLGTRQKGLTSLYNLNSDTGFYSNKYKDALTYNVPNTDKSIIYENLFLPSAEVIGDVQGHITFFRNKILYLPLMDFGINFVGNYINPWEWSKKIIPTSIIKLIESYLQVQVGSAFAYIRSIKEDFDNPDHNIWISDKTDKESFIKSFNNSNDPQYWDQTNWLFNYVRKDSNDPKSYYWKTNEALISNGLPNYTITEPFARLITRMISFPQNPSYRKFVDKLLGSYKNKLPTIDTNFMLGLNVVPVVPELDETYTYINVTSFNNENKEDKWFKIYGIKKDSTQVILWDEYQGIDLKKKLSDYEIKENIYPLIINEVVKEKYGINVNDILKLRVNNKYKRYTDIVENRYNTEKYSFKVIGVTTSKSEEQYYTTQEVANKLIGFEKPQLATQTDLEGKNYDYKWVNQQEIDEYIPFNGVFSKQKLPKMLANFATLYSPSGLSPMSGALPTSDLGDTYRQIQKNYSEINKVLKTNFVDETKPRNFESVKEFTAKYKSVFGTDKYYEPALSKIDATFTTALLGNVMDSTVRNVNIVSIMSLVPAILIIIILMSYMIVVESRRLVALLKVLGFSNWSNTITLSTVQFVVTGIAVLLGYGISAIVLSILKSFAFSSFSIIIAPVIPGWTAALTLGTLLLIISAITLTIFINLRKSNPAQEIAMR